jgi:hypothetical protein
VQTCETCDVGKGRSEGVGEDIFSEASSELVAMECYRWGESSVRSDAEGIDAATDHPEMFALRLPRVAGS